MKALILAAGRGSRLGKLSDNMPKGMLDFAGKPLIKHQIDAYRAEGINEIIIVRGYQKESICFEGIKYIDNDRYATTNMIESIACARNLLDEDVIISYSDVLFSRSCLKQLMNNENSIAITVDPNWKEYWIERYSSSEIDIEELNIVNNKIIRIGQDRDNSVNLDYRYVGINKFTKAGISSFLEIYDKKKKENTAWSSSGKSFEQGYFTDILQEMIDNDIILNANYIKNKWFEIDTESDLIVAREIYSKGRFKF